MLFTAPKPFVALANAIANALGNEEEETGPSSAPVPVASPSTPAPPTQASAPAAQTPEASANAATIVTGRFIPDQEASTLYTQSAEQTERFRRLVEKFDEDRQEPIEWVIRKGAALFCYVAPFVLAVPIGLAVGDVFTPAQASPLMALAVHLLSVFLEVIMPILGLATTISFKRGFKDRSRLPGAVLVALLFAMVSIANALALLFLLERNGIAISNLPASIGILGRSFGSFIIDIGSTVYLTVSGSRSLQKYLSDQRAKIVAVRDVNAVHIEMEQTQIKAAIDRQTALMDMQSKQQRAQTWNEIEKMQSQAMIEQARRSFSNGGDGYRRSSW